MQVIWRIMATFLSLSISAYSFIIHKTVITEQPVIFPCEQECVTELKWTKITPDQRMVAQCSNRRCIFGEGVKNRVSVSPEKKPLLIFNSTAYTDMGSYECQCDGKPICDVRLKVLTPISVRAAVLDRVILPCYRNTFKDTADFQWDLEDRMVLYFRDGNLTVGKGFEEKFSYSEEGYREGNLSLIINQVQSSDEGLYRCYVNDKRDEGYPHSYILSVEDVQCNQSTCFYTIVGLVAAAVAVTVIFLRYTPKWTWSVKKNPGRMLDKPTTQLKSVRIDLADKAASSEGKTSDSPKTKPRHRVSSLRGRRSRQRPRTWSGSVSNPSFNPHGNNKKDTEGLLQEELESLLRK